MGVQACAVAPTAGGLLHLPHRLTRRLLPPWLLRPVTRQQRCATTFESEPLSQACCLLKVRVVVWVGVDLQASVDQMNASDANVEQLITCAFHAISSCTLAPTLFRG